MSKRRSRDRPPGEKAERQRIPQPVSVVNGIPDRRERTPNWMVLAIAGAFLAWLAFLIYCAAAGGV